MAQKVTFLSASAGVNRRAGTWVKLELPHSAQGVKDGTPQLLVAAGNSDKSSGSAVITLVIEDTDTDGTVVGIQIRTLTFTPSAIRAATAGASGDYICTVSSSDLSNDKTDIGLHNGANRAIYVGAAAAFTTVTSLDVWFDWVSKV